jgi:epoxyqueuosine reductase
MDWARLAAEIKCWGAELGLQQVGIAGIDLAQDEARLLDWLAQGRHGGMDYMARHGLKRSRPAELQPGTLRVVSARLDYLPEPMSRMEELLQQAEYGYISRYALGRDYHKLLRGRLAKLGEKIAQAAPGVAYRAFCDSAPVLEKPLGQQAGLGWVGKHTNLINQHAGSWFFLGELYLNLPLPVDFPSQPHCGTCQACIEICPTRAITAPYQLDARRCISYLTIELHGSIPVELRPLLGNRIYGCDDCQLVCPWNRFAKLTTEADFLPRHGLDAPRLVDLFGWDEAEFLRRVEGSPIRRLGHARWLRNIAVALGNAPPSDAARQALQARLSYPDASVREHVEWALARHSGNMA